MKIGAFDKRTLSWWLLSKNIQGWRTNVKAERGTLKGINGFGQASAGM
jgi:hypothetical protein